MSIGIRFISSGPDFDGTTLVNQARGGPITRIGNNRYQFECTAAVGRFFPDTIIGLIATAMGTTPLDIMNVRSSDLARVSDWMLERAFMQGNDAGITGELTLISPPTSFDANGNVLTTTPPEVTTSTSGVLLFGCSGRIGDALEAPASGGVVVLPSGYGIGFTTVSGLAFPPPVAEFTLIPWATARDLGCLACGVPNVAYVAPGG
jgi:hypothetical protein